MRMKLIAPVVGLFALLIVVQAHASWIPPRHATVITRCGQVTAVYTSTRAGFQRHTGADAIRIANKIPFNLRVESGCSK